MTLGDRTGEAMDSWHKGVDMTANRSPRKASILIAHLLVYASIMSSVACDDSVKQLWKYRSNSASRSSPGLWGNLIVFGTRSGEVHAVSTEGAFKWRFNARKEVVSAPVVMGNAIYFGSTDSNFYAIDHAGRQVWKFSTRKPIKGDPVAVGDDIVFGSYDGHLYRLGARNAEVKWIFPPRDEEASDPTESATKNLVGAATEQKSADTPPLDPVKDAEAIAAIENAKKAELAKKAALAEMQKMSPQDGFSYAQPTLTSNGLIVAGNLDGYVYAVNAETGAFAWRFAPGGEGERKGITSTVVERDGVLYFGSNDGKVYAVGLSDRQVKWSFPTQDEVNSSPVLDDGNTLYIGSRDKKFYAIDRTTGKKKWMYPCAGPVLTQPVLYKNLVIFGAGEGDGHVYALNTANGEVFWRFKTEGAVDGDPFLNDNKFYISSEDRNLYAFEIKKTP